MSKAQYNRARAAILTPEGQATIAAFRAGYDQRPEVITGRAQARRDDTHPVLAARYRIDLDGTWSEISRALYTCYADSGRAVGVLRNGHGSFITDVDPYGIQAAWIAASRLAQQEVR